MKKLTFILTITLSFILLGCGKSNDTGTTKITKFFEQSTGYFQLFTGEIDTQNITMVETEHNYIKIIDTNKTYQAYGSELNQSFGEGAWRDRQDFVPLQSQLIDFEKNRLFLYGIFGYAGNGFKEDIYLLSETEAKLIITKRPYNGLYPSSGVFTMFAYIIDRQIKTLHLSETLKIDLNDTSYY